MRLGSLRNARDERIRFAGRGSRVVEGESDRVKSKGEKDGEAEDCTWLEQLMSGEPLEVTWSVTSYLDTFSLTPPPCSPPSSFLRLLVATPGLVAMDARSRASIKGNSVAFRRLCPARYFVPSRHRLLAFSSSSSSSSTVFFFAPSFPRRGFLRPAIARGPVHRSPRRRNRIDMRLTCDSPLNP